MNNSSLTIIERSRGWRPADLRELYRYREILRVLCWRDIVVRYKQSAIGIAWAILQPVGTMIVFSFIFGGLVGVSSDNLPYPIFSYCGLLPWMYFQRALTQGSGSLVSLGGVLSKIYFPRLLAPTATVLTGLFDFAIAFVVLAVMMLWYGIIPAWPILLLPAFLIFAAVAALAVTLWLSVLNVEYRDVQHAIPFLAQIWMFATPIVYPSSLVPEAWRPVLALNPMATVVEGFRWALIGGPAPTPSSLIVSVSVVLVIFGGGLVVFERFTRTFADRV